MATRSLFTNRLNGADVQAMADHSSTILRTKNTAYAGGVKVTTGGLPVNYILMCTGSGTTADADITLPATIAAGATFTDGTVTWQIQKLVTTEVFAFRQPSTAVTAASIVFCPGLPSGFYLECKTAGTTGSGAITLPAQIIENAEVTDGTITWTIRKIGSGGGEAVGVIKAFAGNGDIPSGYLLCDGSAVSRTMYPDLFSAIGTIYGSGDGSTTFNLPDYNTAQRFVQGSTVAGTEKEAGLPNIEGSFSIGVPASNGSTNSAAVGTVEGAFYTSDPIGNRACWAPTGSAASLNNRIANLDASRSNPIYGNSSTVQPPALTTRYIIKAFDGQTPDSALIDITMYAQELAGKANITGSNLVHHRDVITTSGTYTAPVTGLYKITVKGGGGGGEGGGHTASYSFGGYGGGEGGTTIAYERMKIDDTITVIIGGGGNGGAANASGTGASGSAGGSSSVTVNGTTYTGGGGAGGGAGTVGGSGTIRGACGGARIVVASASIGGAAGGGTGGSTSSAFNNTGGGGGGGTGAATPTKGGTGGSGFVCFEYYTPA